MSSKKSNGSAHAFKNPFEDFAPQFSEMMGKFPMPQMDWAPLWAKQQASWQKNIAAMQDMQQIAQDCFGALRKCQHEMAEQGMSEFRRVGEAMSQAQSPQERMAQQAAMAKDALEMAMAGGQEVSEILTKSGRDAMDIVNQRFTETMSDVEASWRQS